MKTHNDDLNQELQQKSTFFEETTFKVEEATSEKYEAVHLGEVLRDRNYTVNGKKASKKKDSEEMQAIIEKVEDLNSFFEKGYFNKNDEEGLKEIGGELLKKMKSLAEMTDNYVSTKNPWFAEGKARLNIVKQMNLRLQRDIVGMEEKLNDFKSLPEEEKARINSWTDFLNLQRTIHLVDGQKGVKISSTGGNTSDVIVIEKNGQKFFFKEEERLKSDDFGAIMDDRREELKKELEGKEIEEGSVEDYARTFIAYFKRDFENASPSALFDFLISGGGTNDFYTGLKQALRVAGSTSDSRTGDLIYAIDQMEDLKKQKEITEKIGQIFNSIRKDYVMGDIGTNTTQIRAGEEMAKRNVATARLAKLLGLSSVVPTSEMATIEVGGKKMYGVIMGEAQGQETQQIIAGKNKRENKGKKVTYTGNAIRDSLHLQVLDILCGQTDRHEGNRMSKIEKTNNNGIRVIDKVTGIDGDLSFGERSYSSLKVEDSTGFGLPAMSEEVAERIMQLDPAVLDYEMMGLLNKRERKALKERLLGMQAAIQKRRDYEKQHPEGGTRFLSDDKWNDFTNNMRERAKNDKKFSRSLAKTYIVPDILVGMKMK
ncbi:MAG: hypothetical protein IIZ61_09795 [Lachnospiraceae bacterium]|nr:hypothetical protein [Lachnospiraceae bacterium]